MSKEIGSDSRLAEIAVFPENPLICKYGSKHLTDDEAIGLLEQFLAKVRFLRETGDESEDWNVREAWLLKSISELWRYRGLYPGLLKTLKVAGATPLIDAVKDLSIQESQEKAYAAAFEFLDSRKDNVLTTGLDVKERKKIARNWMLMEDSSRLLLRDILPRLDLTLGAMDAVASEQRADCAFRSNGRGLFCFRTATCCRRARISVWSAARSAKISMILCMPEMVSGGDAKFQGFCDGWNKWEGQVKNRVCRSLDDVSGLWTSDAGERRPYRQS